MDNPLKGTFLSPKKISCIDDFSKLDNSDDYFKLTSDIDASETFSWERGFKPVENFGGKLDGNGHKIENLYIKRKARQDVGLFGSTSNTAEIVNLRLENSIIIGARKVGGIVGTLNKNGKIENCSVENCYIEGTSLIGGICGLLVTSDVMSCHITDSYLDKTNGDLGIVVGKIFGNAKLRDVSGYNTTTNNSEIIRIVGSSTKVKNELAEELMSTIQENVFIQWDDEEGGFKFMR